MEDVWQNPCLLPKTKSDLVQNGTVGPSYKTRALGRRLVRTEEEELRQVLDHFALDLGAPWMLRAGSRSPVPRVE